MPYVNPYSTSLPGIDEARLLALQAMIVASLTDLNSALNRDSLSPMTLQSSQIILGDPEALDTSLICIVGGGKHDATDMEIEGLFMPRQNTSGRKVTLFTNMYVYLHPNEMHPANDDPLQHVAYREMARARICDHIRYRVFNAAQGAVIQLTSQEFTSGGEFDTLKDCHIKQIAKGMTPKNAGGVQMVCSAHLMHCGYIA